MNSQLNLRRNNRINQRYLRRKIEKILSMLRKTRIPDRRVLISGNLNNIIILLKLMEMLKNNRVTLN